MKLTDEKIMERLRRGERVTVRCGMITIGIDSESFAEMLDSIGNLKHKDWEMVK